MFLNKLFLLLLLFSINVFSSDFVNPKEKINILFIVSNNGVQTYDFIHELSPDLDSYNVLNIHESSDDEISRELKLTDKIILIGNEAFKYYLPRQVDKKSIVVYVKRSTFFHLMNAYKHLNLLDRNVHIQNNISAVYSDPDIDSQMSIISNYYTEKAVSVIVSPLNDFMTSYLHSTANKNGLSLNILNVESDVDINRALNSLPNKHALLAIPDPLIFNRHTLKNIIISSYRNNRPLFGYSENMVKAGSVASYFVETKDLARQVNEILGSIDIPYRGYSKYNQISVNFAVARSLNLKFKKIDNKDSL